MGRDRVLHIALVAILFLCASLSAMADPVTYTLATSTGAKAADVKLNLSKNGKAIDVTIQMLGDYTLAGWGLSVFGFNSKYSDLHLDNFSNGFFWGTNNSSPTEVGGFGSFEYAIRGLNLDGGFTSLSFRVARGGWWTKPQSKKFDSVEDIVVASNNGSPFALTLGSGWETNPTYAGLKSSPAPSPVPEPASLALLGTGLVAVGGFVRRWRRKNNA